MSLLFVKFCEHIVCRVLEYCFIFFFVSIVILHHSFSGTNRCGKTDVPVADQNRSKPYPFGARSYD